MKNRRSYYRILHVDRDAPPAVVQASYRTLMQRLRMHPDLGGDVGEAALLNEAFAVLSDPAKRAAYDETLRRGRTPPAVTRPPRGGACPFCEEACRAEGRDDACPACGSPLWPAAEHRTGEDSRRAMERLPRELAVTFRRGRSPQGVLGGETKDLSLNGMRLVSPVRLAVGELLSVESDVISAVAVVRSVSGGECGLEFVTLRFARDRGVLVSTVA